MRNAALILLFVALGYAAKSQRFTLLPQVGFENSNTKISYNDLESFSPIGVKFSPSVSLRLNYSSKAGHGFFIGAASSQSTVAYSFADPETGQNSYTATAGNMQLRLEGGYQFNTKPITIGKSKPASPKTSSSMNKSNHSCSSHCCFHSCNRSQGSKTANSASSWMRIQPSIGMAYIPGIKSDVSSKTVNGQDTYQYNAGNWNTAVIAGTGFEFGRGSTRQFTVSVNYLKGIGNLDEKTISSLSSGKLVTTTLSSTSSAWNVKIGIPFSLSSKSKPAKRQPEQHRSGCGQYRMMYRCGGRLN